jgi:hypothetical protein
MNIFLKNQMKLKELLIYCTILITIILIMVLVKVVEFYSSDYWKYEKPATIYINQTYPSKEYKYIGLTKKPFRMYIGNEVDANFKSELTNEEIQVVFRGRDIVPMAKAN